VHVFMTNVSKFSAIYQAMW